MSKLSFPSFVFLSFIGIVVLSSSAYVIDETEQVIITEFGKAVGTPINSDPNKN